jgi:hypothetical protein
MASGPKGAEPLDRIDSLFRFGVVGDLSDGQLVQRFLTGRDGADQAALSALVERHGPMVLSVCGEVLGNWHDAQDAFPRPKRKRVRSNFNRTSSIRESQHVGSA